MRYPKKIYRDKDWLIDQHYTQGKMIKQIAKEIGVTRDTIGYWLRANNIKTKSPCRENHPQWKGGRFVGKKDGYIRVRTEQIMDNGYALYMLEHRFVMEKHLGRKLKKDEIVHHIDGDRQNNNVENLEILSPSGHRVLKYAAGYKNGYQACAKNMFFISMN